MPIERPNWNVPTTTDNVPPTEDKYSGPLEPVESFSVNDRVPNVVRDVSRVAPPENHEDWGPPKAGLYDEVRIVPEVGLSPALINELKRAPDGFEAGYQRPLKRRLISRSGPAFRRRSIKSSAACR